MPKCTVLRFTETKKMLKMLPVQFLKNAISSGLNNRQYVMPKCLKRCYCAPTSATNEVVEKPKPTESESDEAVVEVISQNHSKCIILNFFNNCDHVTLNKLLSYKVTFFKNYIFREFMTPNAGNRFHDIEDFLVKTGVNEKKLNELAKIILLFEKFENTKTGMKFFHPPFLWKDLENLDKVVALDVFHKEFAWCERNTRDGYITDIGFEKLYLKDSYDHLTYHYQIRKFLERIPESQVYLLRTSSARNKVVSRQGSRYAVHQAVVESLVITMLNERHQPISLLDSVHRRDTKNESAEQKNDKTGEIENRVYLFEPVALKDFYDVTFQKELLAVSDLFKDWYYQKHPNIQNWGLNTPKRKDLFMNQGGGQVSVCALVTDVFCRTLKKRDRSFPRAYTSKTLEKYLED